MKQIGSFEIDVFKHGVKVFVGFPDDDKPNETGRCEVFMDKQLVHLYFKDKQPPTHIIMHECIHAADFILYNIGANMDAKPDNSEIRAYLAEYIYSMVGVKLGFMKKLKVNPIHKKIVKRHQK